MHRYKKKSLLFVPLVMAVLSTHGASLADEESDEDHTPPTINVGIGLGPAYHFSWATVTDQVTGASVALRDESRNDTGASSSVFADFNLLGAGAGRFGILTGFSIGYPDLYYSVFLTPKFSFEIERDWGALRAVAPWFGFSLSLAWIDRMDSDIYLVAGPSLGLDFRLFRPWLYLGFRIDVSILGFLGTEGEAIVEGETQPYRRRYGNVRGELVLGFRVNLRRGANERR